MDLRGGGAGLSSGVTEWTYGGEGVHNYTLQRIRVSEHGLQVNFLFTIRACLFLPDHTPASNAELVEAATQEHKCHTNHRLSVQPNTTQ